MNSLPDEIPYQMCPRNKMKKSRQYNIEKYITELSKDKYAYEALV